MPSSANRALSHSPPPHSERPTGESHTPPGMFWPPPQAFSVGVCISCPSHPSTKCDKVKCERGSHWPPRVTSRLSSVHTCTPPVAKWTPRSLPEAFLSRACVPIGHFLMSSEVSNQRQMEGGAEVRSGLTGTHPALGGSLGLGVDAPGAKAWPGQRRARGSAFHALFRVWLSEAADRRGPSTEPKRTGAERGQWTCNA